MGRWSRSPRSPSSCWSCSIGTGSRADREVGLGGARARRRDRGRPRRRPGAAAADHRYRRAARQPAVGERRAHARPGARRAVVDRGAHRRQVRLPELNVSEPALRLETRPDGPPNWQFPERGACGASERAVHRRLRIAGAAVHYLDHGSGRSVDAELAEVTGSTDAPEGGMQLAATGEFRASRSSSAQRAARRAARADERGLPAVARASSSARAISPATSS